MTIIELAATAAAAEVGLPEVVYLTVQMRAALAGERSVSVAPSCASARSASSLYIADALTFKFSANQGTMRSLRAAATAAPVYTKSEEPPKLGRRAGV